MNKVLLSVMNIYNYYTNICILLFNWCHCHFLHRFFKAFIFAVLFYCAFLYLLESTRKLKSIILLLQAARLPAFHTFPTRGSLVPL